MIWLTAAAAAVSTHVSPSLPTSRVVVQAQATVRIVQGVQLKLDGATNADAPAPHETTVDSNGSAQPARLIEFE
ncbi:MAG TPA: hypothetical protein VIV07_10375 [Sphingomicrobium sp.]